MCVSLVQFRELLGEYSLISGAGVDSSNVYEQLQVADSVIVGSYFKPQKNTHLHVNREKVRDLMTIVQELRKVAPF